VPVDPDVLAEVLTAVRRQAPDITADDWAPSVQGAVGHVVGLRDTDGAPLVLKIYPRGEGRHLDIELRAQRLLRDVRGVSVPRPIAHGHLASGRAGGFLLMTRLGGVRWADRRARLSAAETTTLTEEVGRTLRRVHGVRGEHFGALADGEPSWPTAWGRVAARAGKLVRQYVTAGGSSDLADRVHRFVYERETDLASCPGPVLCHNDFIDGNLLVAVQGEPRLCAVVDLERASWDDPLSDLAQTRVHVRHHVPADTSRLTDAYGVDSDSERRRIEVYEVLHVVRERTWIAHDRPAGWQRSIAALDAFVGGRT
jgi:hygromycin-B 7''-O-kinase